jgi:CO/xanthine dehydrogenase Mo-binding subunit
MANIAVGKPSFRIDGPLKVTGQIAYAADLNLQNSIWGKALRSPKAHASILGIDLSNAKKVPGVLDIITAADLPDVLIGRRLHDMSILAREKVRYVGERVAVVAALDLEAAEEAVSQIHIEYDDMPSVFDPLEAVGANSPILHPKYLSYRGRVETVNSNLANLQSFATWELGDIDQGFKQSDHIFEQTFTTPFAHQGYIEPHAAIVQVNSDNKIQIWASNKVPYDVRKFFCEATGVSPDKVIVNILAIGGDFGGKGSLMDIPLCYYLALRAGKPVKMVMSYAEELMAGNPRHPSVVMMKTGVTNEGLMVAREARIFWNGGAYGAMKPNAKVNLQGAAYALGPYRIPHVRIESAIVYTNTVPCGHVRGPGHVQTTFAGESQLDIIAESLGIDPIEFRIRNAIQDGDLTPDKKPITQMKFRETLTALSHASGWKTNSHSLGSGIGMAVSYSRTGGGDANVKLSVDNDGGISLLITYTDQGTGCYTVMCQIVAEVLGVSLENVKLVVGSTDVFNYESGTGASRVTYVLGHATMIAALDLKAMLQKLAAIELECPEQDVIVRGMSCYRRGFPRQRVSLGQISTKAAQREQRIEVQKYFNSGEAPNEGSISAVVAHVQVDIDTGEITVRKIITAHDVGTVLNPLTHQGQIDGSIIQGFGFTLTEEMQSSDGHITTLNLGEYKLPNIKDIPTLRTVLVTEGLGAAPFAAKEIGESAISPVSAAIANAIFNAAGVRVLELPITAEKVYAELGKTRLAKF